MSTFIFL